MFSKKFTYFYAMIEYQVNSPRHKTNTSSVNLTPFASTSSLSMLKIITQDESHRARLVTQMQLCFIPPKPLATDEQH